MKNEIICLLGVAIALLNSAAFADYAWFTNTDPASASFGHQYALTNSYGSWQDCENEAVAMGGNLVAINDVEENNWLLGVPEFRAAHMRNYPDPCQLASYNVIWIGHYWDYTEEEWLWSSGESVTYTNYDPTYFITPPGGTHGPKTYLHGGSHSLAGTWGNAAWHNDTFDAHPRGIIEVVPEPATLMLMVLGGLALLKKRNIQ